MNIDLVPITSKADTQDFMRAVASQYEDDLIHAFALAKADAERKTYRDMRAFLEGTLDPECNHLFFIRDLMGAGNVGAIWLVTEKDVGIAWLCYVHIYARHRRRGYATAAIRRLHDEARELGCRQMHLYVHSHNLAAQALYGSLGYQNSSYFMRLPLQGAADGRKHAHAVSNDTPAAALASLE